MHCLPLMDKREDAHLEDVSPSYASLAPSNPFSIPIISLSENGGKENGLKPDLRHTNETWNYSHSKPVFCVLQQVCRPICAKTLKRALPILNP